MSRVDDETVDEQNLGLRQGEAEASAFTRRMTAHQTAQEFVDEFTGCYARLPTDAADALREMVEKRDAAWLKERNALREDIGRLFLENDRLERELAKHGVTS